MSHVFDLILTHAVDDVPEVLRDAALAHLGTVVGLQPEVLARRLQQLRPVLATVPDAALAASLQADLLRAGWKTELQVRPDAPPPALAPVLAPPPVVACPACGYANATAARFCSGCGASLGVAKPRLGAADGDASLIGVAASKMASMAGLQGVQRFSLGELLSDVFKRRTPVEIEDHLTVGTLRTTPAVADMQTDWPKPWLFARAFCGAVLLYLVFLAGLKLFGNPNLLPGLIMVGCFVVPCSALLLFYEFNTPRNVSLKLVIQLVMMGGALSIFISLVLFEVGTQLSTWLGASAAGLIEETGKLAAVVYATRKLSPVRYRYTLNGLLFGAAVGTGFAAFESAGYALRPLLEGGNVGDMTDSILLRGLLSPFAHLLWTGLAAGALWRVKGAQSYSGILLADGRFLRIFFVSVLCHVVWNAPFMFGIGLLKYVVLGFIGWAIALSLVQDGLMQVKREQQSCG
jgi:RsiW-degrading membrane proteinase PrsW (M82 family)